MAFFLHYAKVSNIDNYQVDNAADTKLKQAPAKNEV
jgi:hypothetical protein